MIKVKDFRFRADQTRWWTVEQINIPTFNRQLEAHVSPVIVLGAGGSGLNYIQSLLPSGFTTEQESQVTNLVTIQFD
jgi:hypothetical protein